jgi:hypothetical protein
MALRDGLVAYYKFDEGAGNVADSTGNGKTLTNVSTMPFGTGKINNGITPDGTNRMVVLSGDNLGYTRGSQSMSWNFWVKASNWNSYIIQIRTSLATGMNTLIYGDGASHAKMYISGNEVTSSVLSTNTWYMFTIVKTGTTYEFFVNNVSQGTTSEGAQTSTVNCIAFGANSNDGTTVTGSPLNGGMDEAGVWSKSLTSDERIELYNAGSGIQLLRPTTKFRPGSLGSIMS